MQHGLLSSSDFWSKHADDSPAFILAKNGYNVFVGNNRGNKYCLKHHSLNPELEPEMYNDYSFYEMGKFDATA